MPARSLPVCRSGTLAIRSEARARASAAEKPPTIATISRSSPNDFKASIDRPLVQTPPRDEDMPAGRIARGRDLAPAQRVPLSHDADEAVAEQGLRPHLRTHRLAHDARFQIDGAIAKRRAVLVRLGHEAQPHAGRLPAGAGNEVRSEILHEAFAGPSVKVRTSCLRSSFSTGRSTACASCTSSTGPARGARARGAWERGRARP